MASTHLIAPAETNVPGWPRLIAAHKSAREAYAKLALRAAEALNRRVEIERRRPSQARISAQLAHSERLAGAEREELTAEAEADQSFAELSRLERLALSRPATNAESFQFKLTLLADGPIEGRETEWRLFLDDCARMAKQSIW